MSDAGYDDFMIGRTLERDAIERAEHERHYPPPSVEETTADPPEDSATVADIDIEADPDHEREMNELAARRLGFGGVRRVGPKLVGAIVKGLDLSHPDTYHRVGDVTDCRSPRGVTWHVRKKATDEWFRVYVDGDFVTTMSEEEAEEIREAAYDARDAHDPRDFA